MIATFASKGLPVIGRLFCFDMPGIGIIITAKSEKKVVKYFLNRNKNIYL